MKFPILIACLALLPAPAHSVEILDNVESERVAIDAPKATILQRSVTCMAALFRYDMVKGSDTSRSVVIGETYVPLGTTQYAGGGNVVEHVDEQNGIVVGNNRFLMPGLFGDYVQSRVIVRAEDGAFSTTHVQIQRMAQQSGLMENSGFGPVLVQKMSGHAKVRKALLDVSAQLGRCIAERESQKAQ